MKTYTKQNSSYANFSPSIHGRKKVGRRSLYLKTIGAIISVIPACLNAATVAEIESNDLYTTAQFIGPFAFTSEAAVNIQDSTLYKHTSISASGDGTVDWFVFNHSGGRMILDIDGGMPTVDLEVGLWDIAGNLVVANDDGGLLDPGTVHGYDSYIDLSSAASGLYYVAVSNFPSGQSAGFEIGGAGFTTDSYTLNISSGAIPEPSGLMLSLMAAGGIFSRRRRS